MLEPEIIELATLQINRANEILSFIPSYIDLGDYNTTVNRSYYAAFHAIKAIEITDGFDSKKHSGLLSHFRQNYIKSGILDERYSEILKSLSQLRNDSDYNIVIKITLEEAESQYKNAVDFVNATTRLLEEKIK